VASRSGWLDAWLDVTKWWMDPVGAMSAGRDAGADALAELADGIARRFEGRQIDVTVQGTRVQGTLDSLRLLRRGGYEIRAELRDGSWDEVPFVRATAVAASAQLHAGTSPRLELAGVDVDAEVPIAPAIVWLDQHVDGWHLSIDDAGDLWARDERREVDVRVEPAMTGPEVAIDVVGARWRGRTVGLPRWLRLRRHLAVALPDGVEILRAVRVGDVVHARFRLGPIDEPVDLTALRRSISNGLSLVL
jgi:hypothetical protein